MSEYAFSWERSAMEGTKMPDGLSLSEQKAWQALASLYARFRLKIITREDGHDQKGKIVYQLEKEMRSEQTANELAKWHVDLRKNIETAQNRYMRAKRNMEKHPLDPSMVSAVLEAADLMCSVIDGRIRNLRPEEEAP